MRQNTIQTVGSGNFHQVGPETSCRYKQKNFKTQKTIASCTTQDIQHVTNLGCSRMILKMHCIISVILFVRTLVPKMGLSRIHCKNSQKGHRQMFFYENDCVEPLRDLNGFSIVRRCHFKSFHRNHVITLR